MLGVFFMLELGDVYYDSYVSNQGLSFFLQSCNNFVPSDLQSVKNCLPKVAKGRRMPWKAVVSSEVN